MTRLKTKTCGSERMPGSAGQGDRSCAGEEIITEQDDRSCAGEEIITEYQEGPVYE